MVSCWQEPSHCSRPLKAEMNRNNSTHEHRKRKKVNHSPSICPQSQTHAPNMTPGGCQGYFTLEGRKHLFWMGEVGRGEGRTERFSLCSVMQRRGKIPLFLQSAAEHQIKRRNAGGSTSAASGESYCCKVSEADGRQSHIAFNQHFFGFYFFIGIFPETALQIHETCQTEKASSRECLLQVYVVRAFQIKTIEYLTLCNPRGGNP